MGYSIYEFTRCCEYSCENDGPVGIDYYYDGNRYFLNFYCSYCSSGGMEDDIEYYVRCPNCHDKTDDLGRVERVSGEVTETGEVHFSCSICGASARETVTTRWDSSDSKPIFEPFS